MIEGDRGIILRQVGTLFRAGTFAGMSDGQLLERFLARGGEAGELAFSVLVERHGPMVLRVCRGVLGDRHDAEDAFQATFLALVRGAGAIRRRDSVAPWLHGAALRISACARTAGARRRRHEGRFAARRGDSARDRGVDDLGPVLHEEVGQLPSRYRAAVVLCDFEGLSLDEAARHLDCPIGTVKSRVARGRARLRDRLARRGLAPTASAVGLALAREARAAVRPALAEATARLALRFASGRGTAGMLVSPAEWLARLDHRRLFMARLRSMTAALATIGVLAAGATLLGQQGGRAGPAPSEVEEKGAAADALLVKTYAVADLVSADTNHDWRPPKGDMGPLIDLLTSTVAPGTWRVLDEDGRMARSGEGPGSITPFRLNLNLIVRQTPEAHALLAERLAQLRRVLAAREERVTSGGTPAAASQPDAPRSSASMGMMGQPSPAGSTRKGTDVRAKMRQPMRPGMAVGPDDAPGAITIGPGARPGTADGRISGMRTMAPGSQPGTASGATTMPGGSSLSRGSSAHTVDPTLPPGAGRMDTTAPAAPGGAASSATEGAEERVPPPASRRRSDVTSPDLQAQTEQRLRSLEEKLDRVLKALDAAVPDTPKGAAGP